MPKEITVAQVLAGWRPSDAKPKERPGWKRLAQAVKSAPKAPVPASFARPPAF